MTNAGSTHLAVPITTNNGNFYRVLLHLPLDYPNSKPTVIVTYPSPLVGHGNVDITTYGASEKMHTLEPIDGYVQICHYLGSLWHPNVTLYKVLIKARLWLEAFEGHRKSGKPLSRYLKSQL